MRITEKKLRKLIRETIESTMWESADDDYSSNPIFRDFGDSEIVGSEDDELDDDDMYSDSHYMSDIEVPDLSTSDEHSSILPDDLDDWRDTDTYRSLKDPSDDELDLIEDPMYMDTYEPEFFEN